MAIRQFMFFLQVARIHTSTLYCVLKGCRRCSLKSMTTIELPLYLQKSSRDRQQDISGGLISQRYYTTLNSQMPESVRFIIVGCCRIQVTVCILIRLVWFTLMYQAIDMIWLASKSLLISYKLHVQDISNMYGLLLCWKGDPRQLCNK